jgi:hypothetical protein
MLPIDGQFTVYLIVFENGKRVSTDYYGYPPVTGKATCALSRCNLETWSCSQYHVDYIHKKGDIVTHPSVDVGFSACGDCWQKLRIHGTFSREAALEGLQAMRKRYTDVQFALKQVLIQQVSTILEQ